MRRTTKILFFLFLILLIFVGGFFGFINCLAASSTIIINEIQTAGTTTNDEFVELYNLSGQDINLADFKLTKKSSTGTESNLISPSKFKGIIPAHGYFLISHPDYKDTVSADLPYSGSSFYISTDNTIILYDVQLTLVDKVGFGMAKDYESFPARSPSERKSIERKNFQDTDNNSNDFNFSDTPTPYNSLFTEDVPDDEEDKPLCAGDPSDIKINEIYPNTEDENDEFVEIINNGTDCVDISSWAIKDSTDISSHKTIFPENTILESGEYFYIEKNLYLNNDDDTVYLLDESNLERDYQVYTSAIRAKSYSFDSINWIWTSTPTAGIENQFDLAEETSNTSTGDTSPDYNVYLNEILPNPKGDEKLGEFIELYNAENSEINLAGWTLKDASKTKYIFPANTKIAAEKYWAIYRNDFNFAMNNSGSETIYLLNKGGDIVSSASYDDAKENVSYNFDATDWHWSVFLTPGEENKFEKKLKVSIIKIRANPKGKDTEGEEIYLKNKSKEKVNLKTWSIATDSKTLYNHPITKDFIIKPGKTKKITRKYSLFALNNKRGAIELRYPDGAVASRVKYDKKKETVKDDEIYELSGKKWQWNSPAEEIPEGEFNLPEGSSASEENSENINPEADLEISAEEITLNLGKYSSENKIALAEIKFKSAAEPLLQSRETPGIMLGAFSVRNENHKSIKTRPSTYWQKTLRKGNKFFNLLLNHVVHLI